MTKMEQLKQEITEKQAQLERLEQEQRQIESSGPEYVLAVELHEKLCHWNHTDGCGWYYEIHNGIHDWTGSSHKRYLEKSIKMMAEGLDIDTVIKVVNLL